MRTLIIAASLAITTTPAVPVIAQTATAKAVTKCEKLATQWRGYEMDLAKNDADGVTDNSAPRATMRAAQDTATFSQAQITLALMEANKCALPDGPPSGVLYLSAALDCALARSADEVKVKCDRSTWKRMDEK